MGLILRASSVANSGNSILVQGSVLSHAQGDGNFMYLLTNMSGSSNSITASTPSSKNVKNSCKITVLLFSLKIILPGCASR